MTETPWHQTTIVQSTSGRGLHDVTAAVSDIVRSSQIKTGLCHLFIQHTSASLLIQENADPDVLSDLDGWFTRSVRDGDPSYRHRAEGPDDMSAHIRSALTQTSLSIPITDGRLALGTWQGIYLFEHRYGRFQRRIVATIHGAG